MQLAKYATIVIVCMPLTNISYADHPNVLFGSDKTGPINTIAADTLPKGFWVIGLRTEGVNFKEFSDTQLENYAALGLQGVHSLKRLTHTSLNLGYGVSDDLTLSFRQSYVHRSNIREGHLELGIPEVHLHGDAAGIGNLNVVAQYKFFSNQQSAGAVLVGVTLPTGKNNRTDNSGTRLETEFQPNSGSTDYHMGLAYSAKFQSFSLHVNGLYSINGAGDDNTQMGKALFYNLAVSYPLQSHEHKTGERLKREHSHLHWSLVLELNGESRQRNEFAGVNQEHSGGTLVYLAPGVRVSAGTKWHGFLSLALPVLQDMNGIQADVNYRVIAGLSYAF